MDNKELHNHFLGNRIIITKEIEKKYGVYIDIYSKYPLVIGYGEVTIINNDEASMHHTASGGLCFSIESFGSRKDRFHPIFLCGTHCTPRLSFFETPFSQSHQSNHTSLLIVNQRINTFFSEWSRSKESTEIRGNEDDLTLFIYGNQFERSILQIKVLSAKDYYTVAAWFILVEANKHIRDVEKAPIFEMYWPDCSYYIKTELNYSDCSTVTGNKKRSIVSEDPESDLQKRERISPLGFNHLLIIHTIGYYNTDGIPSFSGDANIVNVTYEDGILKFDIVGGDLVNKIDFVNDFTFFPLLYVLKNDDEGNMNKYLGDVSQDNGKDDDIPFSKAETVNAPYMKVWPFFLECRLYKSEGTIHKQIEASVFKTYISKDVLNKDGDLDLRRTINQMILEQTDTQQTES